MKHKPKVIMQGKLTTTIVLLGLSLSLSWGQSTVYFSAAVGERDIYYQGSPLADGNQVRIGFFDPGFVIGSHLADLNALADAWNEYGSTLVRTLVGEPGHFAASESMLTEQALGSFDNQKIYLWIFKTTDNSTPADNFGNVQGYGLYSSTADDWYFPAFDASYPANITSISSDQVNQAFYGSYDLNHLSLSPVPEPTTVAVMVLAIGLLMMASRSRGDTK